MYHYALLACIAASVVLRFLWLDTSPPGFYIDEAMGAAHSLCYQQTGADLFGQLSLFSKIDFGGFQSGPFLISSALWTWIFGTGPVGFRSYMAFIGVITLFALYKLVQALFEDRNVALLATAIAGFLPWAFHFSRISWDAPLATAFLMCALAVLYGEKNGVEQNKSIPRLLISALLMALASYTYAPMRIQAVLFVVFLPFIRIKERVIVLATFGLLNLPVLPYYQDAEFTSRSRLLAITSEYPDNPFHDHGPVELFFDYLAQVGKHLSPSFLVFDGDQNLRHSTGDRGMLDWVTFSGMLLTLSSLLVAAFRRHWPATRSLQYLRLATLGILLGVTPASLTWEGVPHAIRAMGAWPFMVMFATYGWVWALSLLPKLRYPLLATIGVLFAMYFQSYLNEYPTTAHAWFDVDIVRYIRATGRFPEIYQPVSRAYYQMHQLGISCEEVRRINGW